MVTRNLTDSLLGEADITTTKPIENFFGNLDQELKKTGSKEFGKVGDDLIIKYSKDLLKSNAFEWQIKATQEKAKELKILEKSFKDAQRRLICSSVNEEEASILSLTKPEEVDSLVNNLDSQKNHYTLL